MKKMMMMMAVVAMTMTACQESLEDKAAKEASTYTRKNCPTKLSENIILDSMTFERATHTFGYHYTMTGAIDRDSMINEEVERERLLEGLKNLTNLKAYMDEGYAFHYVYRSQADPAKIRLEALFTEDDYRE